MYVLISWCLFSSWLALVVDSERREQEQSEVDYDAIAHRLRQDVVSMMHCHSPDETVRRLQTFLQLDQAGKLQRKVADLVSCSHCCFADCRD